MYISYALVFILKILSVQSQPTDFFKGLGADITEWAGDFKESVGEWAGDVKESAGDLGAEIKEWAGDVKESVGDLGAEIKDFFSVSDEDRSDEKNIIGGDSVYEPLHPHSPPSVYPTQRTVGYVPSLTTPYTPVKKPAIQPQPPRPSQIPPKDSTMNPTPQPQPTRPSQITPQTPVLNPLPQPQTPKPPQISPSSYTNCTCTPFFRCYDEETSSNLTNVVNDRNQDSCPNPNDICCHNLVEPPEISPDNSTLNSSPQPQPPSPPQISPSEVNCTCTPFFRCYDEETSSNLTSVVDDRTPVTDIQESCPNPNDICCYNSVQPPTSNLSPQPQPNGTTLISTQNLTPNLSPQPQTRNPPLPLDHEGLSQIDVQQTKG